MSLLACPFCREPFTSGEGTICPHCDIPLRPFERLPLSEEARVEGGAFTLPEHEPVAAWDLGRGRGVVVGLGLAGLGLFFATWATVSSPFEATYSGIDFARRMGWPWAALAAWLVLVPTALSRRTVVQMVRARIPTATLAAIPGLTLTLLRAFPPKAGVFRVQVSFDWPFWATLAVSACAVIAAFRLGGTLAGQAHEAPAPAAAASPKGETLH